MASCGFKGRYVLSNQQRLQEGIHLSLGKITSKRVDVKRFL